MSKLDPMTALSATATRLRRKQRECRDALTIMGGDRTTQRCIMEARMFAYSEEAERVESLIDVCRGEASTTVSCGFNVDDLPVEPAAIASTLRWHHIDASDAGIDILLSHEAIDATADTLPLMPRSGLTPQP